jgi:nucleoside-diphosphate-sugar epimerase
LLLTSSTSVYAQKAGEWVTEVSAAEPTRETGRVLRETEEFVLARGGIVARLAGIYGPGRSALLRKFLASEAVIESTPRYINQAHRDDIASALYLLIEQGLDGSGIPAERRVYNVADGHPLTDHECYGWLSAHLGRALPRLATSPVERKRGDGSKRVSSDRLRGCGWRPRYPRFQAGMTESILPDLERLGA